MHHVIINGIQLIYSRLYALWHHDLPPLVSNSNKHLLIVIVLNFESSYDGSSLSLISYLIHELHKGFPKINKLGIIIWFWVTAKCRDENVIMWLYMAIYYSYTYCYYAIFNYHLYTSMDHIKCILLVSTYTKIHFWMHSIYALWLWLLNFRKTISYISHKKWCVLC